MIKNVSNEIEYKGYKLLVEIIKNQVEFKKTGEGCHPDVLIRPLKEKEDKWLPVQLKTSLKSYHFHNVEKYNKYLMCFVCINEQKFWLMNGHKLINHKSEITFNKTYGKYDKYIMKHSKIVKKMLYAYNSNKYIKMTEEEGMTPVYWLKQIEKNNFDHHKKNLPFISFIDPDIEHSVFDCTINRNKVQNKTAQILINKQGTFGLKVDTKKNTGHVNKKPKQGPYEEGDNAYYCIHIRGEKEKSHFYFIPEFELIVNGHIKTKQQPGKTAMLLYPQDYEATKINTRIKKSELWSNKYLFSYDELDETNWEEKLFPEENLLSKLMREFLPITFTTTSFRRRANAAGVIKTQKHSILCGLGRKKFETKINNLHFIYLPDEINDRFYLIPEKELLHRDYLSKKKTMCLYPDKYGEWLNDFLFKFDSFDQDCYNRLIKYKV